MTAPWQEVGDRIYRRRYPDLDLNIGAIVCGESVVIVDSRANHHQADELRRELAAITRLPVSTVIDTHYHWDHTFGNARFPEARIVGHSRCRQALADRGAEMKAELLASDYMSKANRPHFEEVVVTPPEFTFEEETSLEIGGRHIDLRHLGLGHTDSDIVITVDGVLFAGDLVEQGADPYFGDAFPIDWLNTLDRMMLMLRGPVVPGHGDIVDADYVRRQRETTAAAVAQALAGALTNGPFSEETMADIAARLEETAKYRPGMT